MTTVSGTKNNSHNSNITYRTVAADKESLLSIKKSKSVFGTVGKDKTVPLVSPPPIMNHVTGHYRRNEDNPQNQNINVNEVEEMETQEGKFKSSWTAMTNVSDI